jgi:hypothetical protein
VHASWLNQIEVYFSIVQRKVLNPNDFSSPATLKSEIMQFQQRYEPGRTLRTAMQTRRRSKTDAFLETALSCSFGSLNFLTRKTSRWNYSLPSGST